MVRIALMVLMVVGVCHPVFAQHEIATRRTSFLGGHSLPKRALRTPSRRRFSPIVQASATKETEESETVHKPTRPAVLFEEAGEKPDAVCAICAHKNCAGDCGAPVPNGVGGDCAGGNCAGAGCSGGCGTAGAECCCGCCDNPEPVLEGLFGYSGWRGHADGAWSNFGLSTGFNLGTPLGKLSEYTGLGAQVGGTIGAYNWAGSDYRQSNQDQVTTQGFLTLGFFRNADEDSHISMGIVQDWMFNETYGVFGEDIVLVQYRAMVGWAFNESDEIGVWGAWRGGDERRNVSNYGRVTWHAQHQVNIFWHHKWCSSLADTWLWIGVPEQDRLAGKGTLGDYVAGAYATVPIGDRLSLYTMVNYVHQSANRGPAAAREDFWNVYVGVSFTPWGSARTKNVRGRRYAPRMPVANNGLFVVDTSQVF